MDPAGDIKQSDGTDYSQTNFILTTPQGKIWLKSRLFKDNCDLGLSLNSTKLKFNIKTIVCRFLPFLALNILNAAIFFLK